MRVIYGGVAVRRVQPITQTSQPSGRPYRPPLRSGREIRTQKLPCAASTPRSGAVRAALEKRSVAVTAIRFYWPARSREGVGRMGRDDLVERNGRRDASSWGARRGAHGSPGAAAPGAFWGLFRGEKSPAGGKQAAMPERCRRTDPPAAGSGRCGHRPLRPPAPL